MKGVGLVVVVFVVVLLFGEGYADPRVATDRPIVGVLTQHSPRSLVRYGPNYIAASYVKYLESAGARVVPVHHDAPQSVLRKAFENLNALLIPGGDVLLDNTTYYKAGKAFFDWSLEAYDQSGDIFPVVGHCLGFELLAIAAVDDYSVLGSVAADNITLPLNFTSLAGSSRMFRNAPDKIMEILGTKPVTMNNHDNSLLTETYDSNSELQNFYNVLSTNTDVNGVPFVSSMESPTYPIFAVQWHPEKPLFEWNPNEVTNHSPDAIAAMQYMADFTVMQARLSKHNFATADEEDHAVIYNFQPVYTYYDLNDFEQAYFFDNWH